MRSLEQLAQTPEASELRLRIDPERLAGVVRQRDEGLFHVPLLSLCVLAISRARPQKLDTTDVAIWIGATLGRHFATSQSAYRRLDWSLAYRRRCADALVFLQNIGLISINEVPPRFLVPTERGNRFLRDALRREDQVGELARGLTRAYLAVEKHGLNLL